MDYRERWEDKEEALLAALDAFSARTWCSGPGFVESVNFAENTCSVQPAIMGRVQAQDGTYSWVKLPLLVDCPIIFLRGGGFTVTVPLGKGDEVMVFFADRCIDAWWSSAQVSRQSEIRFHDLSDGFVLPGPRSKPNALGGISTSSIQIRSDDGLAYMEVKAGHIVNVIAPGGINLNAGAGNITMSAANIQATATQAIAQQAGTTITDTAPVVIHSGATELAGSVYGAGGSGSTVQIDAPVNATGEGTFNGHTVGNHTHTQPNDSAGDGEQPTDKPTG